jgi:hypothetical protein
MNAFRSLVPIDLARRNFDAVTILAISIFDLQRGSAENDGDALTNIAMPRRRFARLQN